MSHESNPHDADSDPKAYLQHHVDEHGFLGWLDLTVEAVDEDGLVLSIPYADKLANHAPGHAGRVHGGIAATIVDTAGGLGVHSQLDDFTSAGVATIDLDVSYLRPAVGDLVATADVIRVGGTVGVAVITVESDTPNDGWSEVAVGMGSFRIFR
ncbi:PaaI family thioesterase [Halocalculus aciditolerans]|uniref:Esterase n=1 Tax=Halocalculus aciditolerans TaxID=1383812 RepID=A0A830FIH8_9EURY|nr:PaaI family thioesterase [Halocalculus aciditolerans]GGL56015.1 esterase [Halocalculus aciditolerans]